MSGVCAGRVGQECAHLRERNLRQHVAGAGHQRRQRRRFGAALAGHGPLGRLLLDAGSHNARRARVSATKSTTKVSSVSACLLRTDLLPPTHRDTQSKSSVADARRHEAELGRERGGECAMHLARCATPLQHKNAQLRLRVCDDQEQDLGERAAHGAQHCGGRRSCQRSSVFGSSAGCDARVPLCIAISVAAMMMDSIAAWAPRSSCDTWVSDPQGAERAVPPQTHLRAQLLLRI